MSWKERADFLIKLLGMAIAAFAIWKYFDERHLASVAFAQERSLSYIERFGNSDLVDARNRLLGFWLDYPEIGGAIQDGQLTVSGYSIFVAQFYPSREDRKHIDGALFQLQVFFDEINHCRNTALCDIQILDAFFCDYSKRFSAAYAPFYSIISRESGAKPVDAGIREFATNCLLN